MVRLDSVAGPEQTRAPCRLVLISITGRGKREGYPVLTILIIVAVIHGDKSSPVEKWSSLW